jgi:NADH-quinone oxidoreductase subunit J
MVHLILFGIFGAICAGAALNMVLQKHPINSALSLIVVMVSLAMLYMLLGAEFVAAVQIIVYAGAIMVLFVFVIMLLNAGEEEHTNGSRVAMLIGFPSLLVGAGVLVYTLVLKGGNTASLAIGQFHGKAEDISDLLFKNFLLPFEVTSVLILIAIMGAVLLARKGGTE